jgi:hypothetical protein
MGSQPKRDHERAAPRLHAVSPSAMIDLPISAPGRAKQGGFDDEGRE